MDEDNMDNQDALDLEGEQDTKSENESEDELAKANKVAKNQKIRAEKAERELKAFKAEKEKKEKETPKNEEKKESNEPDYARLAFLKAEGVTHPDDQKVVQDEAKRLSLPLTDVLQMEHIKSKLKASGEQRTAEAGMPQGDGKSAGSNKGAEDYWVDRKKADGSYDTPADVDLANKVINERMRKETNANMFSEEMYNG